MNTEYKKMRSGIHTLQLTYSIKFDDFFNLKKYCIDNKKQYRSYDDCFTYTDEYVLFDEDGINITLNCYSQLNLRMKLFYMYIRVNPSRIFHKKWETRIFKPTKKNIVELENVLSQAIATLPHFDKKISEFSVSRCDLCTDLYFHNATMVESYIKLCKARDTPLSYETFKLYSDSGHRYIPPQDSVKLIRPVYNIITYNKQAQMKNNRNVFSEKAIQRAKGILRIEIQLMTPKIDYELSKLIKKPYTFSEKILALSIIQRDICHTILSKVFLPGYHFTLDHAIAILNSRNGRTLLTEQVEVLLKQTAKYRSLEKGIKKVKEFYPDIKTKSLFRVLEELNLNPVCVPANWFGKDAFISSISDLLSK